MSQVLLYDADCGFCAQSAQWLTRRGCAFDMIAWQQWPDLAAHGITPARASEEIHAVDNGQVLRGHHAIAAALRATPRWSWVGRLLDSRPLDPLASRAYAWVAAHRHRLPGGTPTCSLEDRP